MNTEFKLRLQNSHNTSTPSYNETEDSDDDSIYNEKYDIDEPYDSEDDFFQENANSARTPLTRLIIWSKSCNRKKKNANDNMIREKKTRTLSEWYKKNKEHLQEQYEKAREIEITQETKERLKKGIEREQIQEQVEIEQTQFEETLKLPESNQEREKHGFVVKWLN